MRIRIIQFEEWLDGGCLVDWAKKKSHELIYTKLYKHESIPEEVEDAIFIMGGPQNPATTLEECPYFDANKIKALIKKYADSNKIVFGICLGSQLIGEALGAKYSHSPYQELGFMKGILTEEGRKDKNLSDFLNETYIGSWHNDMPGLTKDASILMYSEGCPRQIVRYSRFVYGFQTHMEFDHRSLVDGFEASKDEIPELKGPYIQKQEDILAFDTTKMNNLLCSFLDKLIKDYLE